MHSTGQEDDTHAKLDGDGEEVAASLLGDLGTTGNAGKVDKARLDETLGTLDGLEQLLGESWHAVSWIHI